MKYFCIGTHGATSIKVYIYVYEDDMWKLQDSISSSVSNFALDALYRLTKIQMIDW